MAPPGYGSTIWGSQAAGPLASCLALKIPGKEIAVYKVSCREVIRGPPGEIRKGVVGSARLRDHHPSRWEAYGIRKR